MTTDTSNALKTGMDLIDKRWPREVFAALGVPGEILPGVVRAGTALASCGERAGGYADGNPARHARHRRHDGRLCGTDGRDSEALGTQASQLNIMSTRILVAGDHFILPSSLPTRFRPEVETAIEFREYQSPWPGVPFGEIGEVTEASGSEDEVIQALQGVSIYVANHAPLTKKILAAANRRRRGSALSSRGAA